jgi:hypothetical protein
MSRIHSEQVAKSQLLIAGMEKNVELIKNKGLDAKFISKLKSETNTVASYNEECEKIKADARAKTRQLNIKANEVRMQVKEAKKIIKRDFDKSEWHKFGISDSR